MVDAPEHDDAEAALALERARASAGPAGAGSSSHASSASKPAATARSFSSGEQAQQRRPRLEHLLREEPPVGQVEQRAHVPDALLGEHVAFLREGRLHGLRRHRDGRARVRRLALTTRRRHDVEHREEDAVERLLRVLRVEQVVDVRDAELRREARIDRAPLRARPCTALSVGEVREHDVLGLARRRGSPGRR